MAFISEPSQQYIANDIVSMDGGTTYAASATGTTFEIGVPKSCAFKWVISAGMTGTWLNLIQGSWDAVTWFTVGYIGSNGFTVGAATTPSGVSAAGTYYGVLPCPRFIRQNPTLVGTSTGSMTSSLLRHP